MYTSQTVKQTAEYQLITILYSTILMTEGEIGGTCSKHGRDGKGIQDLGIDRRIILDWS
jgi:hypothetical protein